MGESDVYVLTTLWSFFRSASVQSQEVQALLSLLDNSLGVSRPGQVCGDGGAQGTFKMYF